MRRWRTIAVIATLLGAGVAVPVAWAMTDDDDLRRLPSATTAKGDETSVAPDSLVVKLAEGALTTAITSRGARVTGDIPGTGYVRVRPGPGDPAALVDALLRDPAVQSAALDYPRRILREPNDEFYGQYQSPYLGTVRMPGAWDQVSNASGQVVAVIDTGVDATHPDLAGRVLPGYNAVNTGAGAGDMNGHGTFVAGIAAANSNNGAGVAGVAWNAGILPVQVFTDMPGDEDDVAYDSDVSEGIVWAADHGATVINLSLGGPGISPLLHYAVRYAIERNVVVVAAAGNTGVNLPEYPAAFPEVIAVGATDADGRLTSFSTWGDWLDIAAPGFDIVSTFPGNDYYIGDGTSFAAPIVAGVAALVRTQNPHLRALDVADRLRATARDAGPRGIDPYYGYGVLDAAHALGAPYGLDFPIDAGMDELNDTAGQPNLIPSGAGSVHGALQVEGDVDWYSLNIAITLQSVRLTVVPETSVPESEAGRLIDPVLEVFDAGLGLLDAVDNGAALDSETTTVLLSPGTYYVRVRNYSGAASAQAYTLFVNRQPTTFVTTTDVFLGMAATAIVTGDVTGDGLDDVVLVTDSYPRDGANSVVVVPRLLQGGLGQPAWYTRSQAASSYGASRLALADVDKDTRLDVVVAGAEGLEWFRQDESGTLVSQGIIPGATSGTVLAADMDSDGDMDLVGSQVLYTHGDGSSFTASTIPASAGADYATGDVDGDGRLDIVQVAGYLDLTVFYNTIGGWTQATFPSAGGSSDWQRYVAVADLNGDHRDDIVTAGASGTNVFLQDENGGLAQTYTAGDGTAKSLGGADIDGDGRAEVATRVPNYFYLRRLAPDGSLGYWRSTGASSVPGPGTQGIAFTDMEGDGRKEVVAASGIGITVLRIQDAPTALWQGEHVWSVSPAPRAGGVALDASAQVVFATGVDPSTVNSDSVRLVDGRTGETVPTSLSFDPATRTATLTPDSPLHRNKPYRILVDGVTTVAGDPQLRPFSSTFVTADTGPLPELSGLWMHGIAGTTVRVDQLTVPAGDVAELIIRAAAGGPAPTTPTDGTIGYRGVDPNPVLVGFTPATTYFFSLWYRDRAGNLSPRTTAVLRGSTVTMELTSGTSTVTSTDTLRFATTVTGPADDPNQAKRPITLSALCRGGATSWQPVEKTTIWGQPGTLISAVQTIQTRPDCSYRWEFEVDGFMGAISPTVRVTSTIGLPGGLPPRDR